MSAVSYLTLDGSEVSNSARLYAFFQAGLLPSQFQVQNVPCGALTRAAQAAIAACPYLGFADPLSSTVQLGPNSTPPYGNSPPIVPQAGIGFSDGYMVSSTTGPSYPFFIPLTGGQWTDGIVVVAFETSLPVNGNKIYAVGRMNGTYPNSIGQPGSNEIAAELVYASATTAHLNLTGTIGDTLGVPIFLDGPTVTIPPGGGRQWLVLRLAGDVISAEWWTQDPRMGGSPWQKITFTLSGINYGGYTDRQLFGVPGYQTMNAGQQAQSNMAFPEWWATPACTSVANLYPSPFLFPSPSLYPAEPGGSEGILPTTPWTNAARPESADFTGFYIDEVDGLDGDTTRSVDQRMGGLGGAALGPLVQAGRTIKVHGWLTGRSCRGLDYGREWLLDILASTCHPCPDSKVTIRVAAPTPDDGSNDNQGLYELYDVGLTDGPTISEPTDCVIAEVNFTLTAGNGFKYQPRSVLVAATTFASANGSVGVQIPTPGIGTNGAIVTIKAGSSDLLNVYPARQLSTYPADNLYPSDCLYPNDGGLPVTLPIVSCPSGFLIPRLPAGGTLVIDSSRHQITYTDSNGVSQDGTYLLSQSTARAIDWLEADACNPTGGDFVLVGAASYAPDATVEIDVKHRER